MNFKVRGRFSRRELLSAGRVALLATLLVAIAYVGVVAILDVVVADHLTTQVDRQLSDRLEAAVTTPRGAFRNAGVQANGARYGLGIYGEPIGLWAFTESGRIKRTAPSDPSLPASLAPPTGDRSRFEVEAPIDGITYRFEWRRTRSGFLLAGESLTELGHVEAILVTSEAIALPFLVLAFFLVALAIGLRSARPVEIARRRQLDFTADASHELRTPLSVIEAETSLAARQQRSQRDYEEILGRIAAESGRLRRIVDDLLFLARADSEPSPPAGEVEDLSEVAARAIARFQAVAAARGQQLDLARDGALMVVAPSEWLDRLAGTLLDNACRYTPAGGRIEVLVLARGSRAVLSVEDNGPGIDPAVREDVTQRFKRVATAPGGHGLGLAIAASVVRATGGQLSIGNSNLGGARIEASWPRA